MPEHQIAPRAEWQAARAELLEAEKELSERTTELAARRRELPWVAVEKEYTFATEEGQKTLVELFDGRSQLLAYHIMFGPTYSGACPGCSGLADQFDGGVVHLRHRDVSFVAISRAPLPKLQAYKRRMGWTFPWVSSHDSDYHFDFGFALSDEQMASDAFQQLLNEPPEFLHEWRESVDTDLRSGLREGPGWNAFALEDGVVYQTYASHAPDGPQLAPYYFQLLDFVPSGRTDIYRATRHDEYEN